jgi:cytochrome c553
MSARNLMALFVAALSAALASPAQSTDIEAGKAKAASVCAACHGADGNSPAPDFPKLAGQHPDYLAKALRDYQSGRRKNAIMAGFAASLTPADIDNLSAYFAEQPPVLVDKY